MKPLISFILPSYNRATIIREVLNSLTPLCGRLNAEIIVADNNSTDGSVVTIQKEFPRVNLIVLEENLGAISRNLCLDRASGKYVVMLDDDSYPLDDAIETALGVMEEDKNEDIGCIAFNIRRADGSNETAGIYTAFTGCGAMFRKQIFDTIGGYPDDYLYYVEEYDLSCRIWQQGYRILNFSELEVLHLKTMVNRNFSTIIGQLVNNNMLLWSKYLPEDLADEQIRTELWRYWKIAQKESAEDGFNKGEERGWQTVDRYRSNRQFELDPDTARRMLDLPGIRRRINKLSDMISGRRILIFNIGKLIHHILRELGDSGFDVLGIIDDNRYMQNDTFDGIPIHSRNRLHKRDYDAVVIGSSSLSLNDTFEKQLQPYKSDSPVVRMCDYDRLIDYT